MSPVTARLIVLRLALIITVFGLLAWATAVPDVVATIMRIGAVAALAGWAVVTVIITRRRASDRIEAAAQTGPMSEAQITRQKVFGYTFVSTFVVLAAIALAISFIVPELALWARVVAIALLFFAVLMTVAVVIGLRRMRRRLVDSGITLIPSADGDDSATHG